MMQREDMQTAKMMREVLMPNERTCPEEWIKRPDMMRNEVKDTREDPRLGTFEDSCGRTD